MHKLQANSHLVSCSAIPAHTGDSTACTHGHSCVPHGPGANTHSLDVQMEEDFLPEGLDGLGVAWDLQDRAVC